MTEVTEDTVAKLDLYECEGNPVTEKPAEQKVDKKAAGKGRVTGEVKVAGYSTSIDRWSRMHFMNPLSKWRVDTFNTTGIIDRLKNLLRKGSDPVKWNGFCAKVTPKTVFIVDGKSVGPDAAIGRALHLNLRYDEFEFPDKVGWTFTIVSGVSFQQPIV